MCDFPGCNRPEVKNGLCVLHNAKYGSAGVKKEPKPIKEKSSKREALEKEYLKLKKEMMKESNKCEAGLSGCTRVGKRFTDRNNLIRVCRSCHRHITEHPLEAMEIGLTKYRIKRNGQ